MAVGLCTHYARCDQAYLAARLAQLLQKQGIDFSIFADNTPGKLSLPYDNAIFTKKDIKFTDWASLHNVIVWTHVPNIAQLNYANRKNIKTIIAPMWQELVPPFRKVMRRADHVISMSAECQTLFSEIYKLRSAELIPFDPGLPVFRKNTAINHRQVKIFLPWFDRNARCANSIFITALQFLMERMEEAHLTIAITPSRFSPAIVKFFSTLNNRCAGRISILRDVPVAYRPQIYLQHDLTIAPGECDNYGICPLTSLTMGTPVLSLAVSPQVDFLSSESNSVLVKTSTDYDENGVVHALPDYGKFIHILQQLIAAPGYIQKLSQKTNYNLSSRKTAFETVWTSLFNV
jgi:hypothetical protein